MSRHHLVTAAALAAFLGVALVLRGAERWAALCGIAAVYLALLTAGVLALRLRYFLPAHCHGQRDGRQVALTFDDGPDPAATPLILDVLRDERAPATFFVVGSSVELYPELARRANARLYIALHNNSVGPQVDALRARGIASRASSSGSHLPIPRIATSSPAVWWAMRTRLAWPPIT
jgi:hypothetical protein